MSGGNQAVLQELAERIDQADAIVIGGGSGLSSAAGYDHYHWSPSLSEGLSFWELTAKNENVFYACLNREASHVPEHLRQRSMYIQGDLAEMLVELRNLRIA